MCPERGDSKCRAFCVSALSESIRLFAAGDKPASLSPCKFKSVKSRSTGSGVPRTAKCLLDRASRQGRVPLSLEEQLGKDSDLLLLLLD